MCGYQGSLWLEHHPTGHGCDNIGDILPANIGVSAQDDLVSGVLSLTYFILPESGSPLAGGCDQASNSLNSKPSWVAFSLTMRWVRVS